MNPPSPRFVSPHVTAKFLPLLLDRITPPRHSTSSLLFLTGAGIGTLSGLPDYRSPGRSPHRPISHQEFSASETARKRFWIRSVGGFQRFQQAKPNEIHTWVANTGTHGIITQNVDGLHHGARTGEDQNVVELHGNLRDVECQRCFKSYLRKEFQRELIELNEGNHPIVRKMAVEAKKQYDDNMISIQEENEKDKRNKSKERLYNHLVYPTSLIGPSSPSSNGHDTASTVPQTLLHLPGHKPQSHNHSGTHERETLASPTSSTSASSLSTPLSSLRPDGDMNIDMSPDELSIMMQTFILPHCPSCSHNILKPSIVFFGGSVPVAVNDQVSSLVDSATALVVLGTSLATWSSLRIVKRAWERNEKAKEGRSKRINNVDNDSEISRVLQEEISSAVPCPIILINDGPTRADHSFVHFKFETKIQYILRDLLSNKETK